MQKDKMAAAEHMFDINGCGYVIRVQHGESTSDKKQENQVLTRNHKIITGHA